MATNDILHSFSVGQRGPLHRVLRMAGFQHDGRHSLRPAGVLVALLWIPFAVLAFASESATGALPPVALDLSVHARVLLAIPLFFAAEAVLDERCAAALGQMVKLDIVPCAELYRLEHILRRAERVRGSALIEGLLFALALSVSLGTLGGWFESSGILRAGAARMPSLAFYWYAAAVLPCFLFLLYRSLWHWLVWSLVVYRISRLELCLQPTHPDRAGGLSYLSEPVFGFSLTLMGGACVLSGAWATQILQRGTPIQSFTTELVVVVVVALALALGPLTLFVRRLILTRLHGLREYGVGFMELTRHLHRYWFERDRPWEQPYGDPNVSSLTDMDSSFQNIRSMRFVPFGNEIPIVVLAAVLVPILPLSAAAVPFPELIRRVFGMVLGG